MLTVEDCDRWPAFCFNGSVPLRKVNGAISQLRVTTALNPDSRMQVALSPCMHL